VIWTTLLQSKDWEQVVRVSLGQGIGELWEAVRDRVEVSGHEPVWQVTAGSFDSALGYAQERFDAPVVLERNDRNRWWPRVTLTVTTDTSLAAEAPPLEQLATPVVPVQRPAAEDVPQDVAEEAPQVEEPRAPGATPLPPSLEAIFAHQEQQRRAARA
jgi:hypothetical protein